MFIYFDNQFYMNFELATDVVTFFVNGFVTFSKKEKIKKLGTYIN